MEPLKILYSFPHPVGAPGIGTTALNQVRALAAGGARVTLMCTSLHADIGADVAVRETLRIGERRVPHRAFGSPDRALAFHDHRVARLLKRSPGIFDVVHVWPQSALATIAAAHQVNCLSSREAPNTHTAHAFQEAERESQILGVALPRGHSHRFDSRRLRMEEEEYRGADLLFVPSAHVEETFLSRGVARDKLRRHQYGCTFDVGLKGPNDRQGQPFTAAFVGRAEPRKGLHYALEAWLSADCPPGSVLRIAGEFVPGYRDRVAHLLDQPSVECLGFVEDIEGLLRRSDILLLPSVEEGSALVTYEAQACGCIPLVSSAAGALLPPGVQQFVHHPRDVATLTRQLRLLARDPHLREELRQEVTAWSVNLSWRAAGERMISLYQEALAQRTPAVE